MHPACATANGHCRPADRVTYRTVVTVPVEGPMQKACTAEELGVPSFCAGASVHDTGVAMMKDARTTSRSLCSLNSLGITGKPASS